MTGFTDTESCTSCGVSSNVKTVDVNHKGQWVSQAWCEPCRRAKLVRQRKTAERRGWTTGAVRVTLAVVTMTILVALVLGALRLAA